MKPLALSLPGGYSVLDPLGGGPLGGKRLAEIINVLVPYAFGATGFLLILYLIWGGFKWMTSGGQPEKLKEAQGIISGALIGFLIVFTAYWVLQILGVLFGVELLRW